MDKPRVLLSLPHMGTSHVANSAAVESMMLVDQRVQLHVARSSGRPIESNLNGIVRNFLAGDWDYWINLDDDQTPLKNPIDLVFLDKDVIGLPTPAMGPADRESLNPFHFNVYDWDAGENSFTVHKVAAGDEPLQEVDAVGSGCWVVARRVLEKVKKPLSSVFDDDGVRAMGGDLSFCLKAKEAGFKIYAHYDYPCRHFKTVDLYEIMRLMAAAKAGQI